ncbi:SDR family oxidoreductase [uncultured Desulfobacter sp.]|uniref:SDR family NAD(P)-dependent oxidoreductase n=1 Tax=uncultured Desulfobacter sp. TaxID=240139 RepID=UPI0029F495EA|nr:SDR family oxidoreductase [uncultured Desulfobacter sp.]
MKQLADKTALITGGSDGIGFAIATAFAEHGANLVIIGRDEQKMMQCKKQLLQYDVDIFCIAQDITNKEAISEIYTQINRKNIQINMLVNNAGIARFISFRETNETLLDYHFNLNVKVPYLLTQIFLDDLIASQGNVINISSYFSKKMLPDRPSTAYSLTKGAIESFTKALAYELGPNGVRVNSIAPGTITTPQVKRNYEQLNDEAKNRFDTMIQTIYPLQTIGKPDDVANISVFLASNQAKWITGGIFPVDGGLTTN